MAGIEAVVFDFGNVLIKWNPEAWYDARIGREAREKLFAEVPLEEMNLRSDRGEHLADLVAETAAQYPAHADNIHAWYDNWIEMAQPDIPHSAVLLRALRAKGIPTFALSNFGIPTLALVTAEGDCISAAENIHFYSEETNVRLPCTVWQRRTEA